MPAAAPPAPAPRMDAAAWAERLHAMYAQEKARAREGENVP